MKIKDSLDGGWGNQETGSMKLPLIKVIVTQRGDLKDNAEVRTEAIRGQPKQSRSHCSGLQAGAL